jgi:hypothetical protein
MMAKPIFWLIWSNEHRGWWAGRAGYTEWRAQAGHYGFDEAVEIVHAANKYLDDPDLPNEAMVPVMSEEEQWPKRA